MDEMQNLISSVPGTPSGTTILCEEQTQGKGRAERKWSGGDGGDNLMFTFLLKLEGTNSMENINFMFKMNLSIAVSIAESLHSLVGIPFSSN